MNYDLKAIIILSTANNRRNTTELLNSVHFVTYYTYNTRSITQHKRLDAASTKTKNKVHCLNLLRNTKFIIIKRTK